MGTPAIAQKAAWRVYLEPEALRMGFFGFSSGLPLLLVIGTLSFWLREAGVDLSTIGLLSWVGLIYGFKWVWAPFVDRMPIPWLTRRLGRRRAWLLLTQCGVACGLAAMAFVEPKSSLSMMAAAALATAFASATQDIVLDAYRIESASENKQAALSAMYQTGYRLAMIWSGAGALAVAAWAAGGDAGYDSEAWRTSYLVMAASMICGILTTLLSPEPKRSAVLAAASATRASSPLWKRLAENISAPAAEFFDRFGRAALLVLLLIATYRISDIVMGVMANPFYQDMGFTKAQVAGVTKVFGVVMTLAGAFVGGLSVMRWGVLRVLMAGAVLSAGTNLLFAILSQMPPNVWMLAVTVSADNLAAGLSSAAFVAYMSGLTSSSYSATQYALFSSLMLLLPKFLAGFSGFVVESFGYGWFFIATAAVGIPVFFLAAAVSRYAPKSAKGAEPMSDAPCQ